MILYIFVSCIGLGIAFYAYSYFEKVRKIKNRLKILGVPPEKLKGGYAALKELLYDKEMEISEESFLN